MQTPAFFTDETGAVTVDWVLLTAGMVGLGLAATTAIRGGTQNVSEDMLATLSSGEIIQTAFAAAATTIADNGGLHYDEADITSLSAHYASNYTDDDLQTGYTNEQANAADGASPWAVDALGMIEQEAATRGLALDPGENGQSYSDWHAQYSAAAG